MQVKYACAVLSVALVAAACSDAASPTIKPIRAPAASLTTASFTFSSNSYGPNGEIYITTSCVPQYDWEYIQGTVYWPGHVINRTLHKWKRTGCWQQYADGFYNGGMTSVQHFWGESSDGIGLLEADGVETGDWTIEDAPDDSSINFFAGANPNCSFQYYDVYGPSGYVGRYWTNSLDWSLASINGHQFKAVFQCNSEYTP